MTVQTPMINAAHKPFLTAIAGVTTLSLMTLAKPVQAFDITYNFTVSITTNAYETRGLVAGSTYQGSFTYDNAVLTGTGDENVSEPKGNLSLQFNFLNKTYTTRNDLNYGDKSYRYDYPIALFTDGKLQGLDFLVVPSQFKPPQADLGFRLYANGFYAGATDNDNSGTLAGLVAYSNTAGVPEPSEIGGVLVALSLLGAWAIRRRIEQS